ncbi:MAG: ABC transporter substrate-binding protein, partial [Kiloniellaceae bacterium]
MGMRKVLGVAAAVAVSVTLSGAVGAQEAIKIGDINSYKGLPAFTIPYKQGVDLAIEEINAKGG